MEAFKMFDNISLKKIIGSKTIEEFKKELALESKYLCVLDSNSKKFVILPVFGNFDKIFKERYETTIALTNLAKTFKFVYYQEIQINDTINAHFLWGVTNESLDFHQIPNKQDLSSIKIWSSLCIPSSSINKSIFISRWFANNIVYLSKSKRIFLYNRTTTPKNIYEYEILKNDSIPYPTIFNLNIEGEKFKILSSEFYNKFLEIYYKHVGEFNCTNNDLNTKLVLDMLDKIKYDWYMFFDCNKFIENCSRFWKNITMCMETFGVE